MGDERSMQLLAFNFNSRTFAFTRLAQGLSRSVSAFSSFMRKCLDPVINADKCFQYVDDIGLGARSVDEMLNNLFEIFSCIRESGLKLSIDKCQFGLEKIQFLGNTISPEGMTPTSAKVEKFMKTLRIPKNVRQVKRMIGFFQFYKAFLPGLADNLFPFYQLLRSSQEFQLTDKHFDNFQKLKKDLYNACSMTLRLPIKEKQYVIMADASYYAAGYVLLIDDYCCTAKSTSPRKQYAPVSFGSKVFEAGQLKLSIYAKEFLAVHFALQTFGHIVWGIQKPILILTDNRALTRFFQAKTIPSSLWSCVDHVLSFNFFLGHIPGKTNVAADYLSRIHINPQEKQQLRISDRLPVKNVEIECSVKTPDNSISLIQQTSDSSEYAYDELILSYIPTINTLRIQNPLDELDVTENNQPLNVSEEQLKDDDIRTVISWIEGHAQPNPIYLSITQKKYLKQLPRLHVTNGILYRKFFDQTGKASHDQLCLPLHLQKEVLFRIHNSRWRGHIGINRTIAEFRQRFYFPNFTEVLTDYIRNCLTCLTSKPAKQAVLRPSLQPVVSEQNFPADMMQIDLVGKMKSSPFTYILTAMDVFSKYLFAIPLTKGESENVAKALVGIFLRHSYIPQKLVSDLGTAFTSSLMEHLARMMEIKLEHATLKHAQTIGLLERSHGPLKHILRINSDEVSSNWHKFVDFAVFVHNTTYHTAIGCTPSDLFHGRPPTTPLDLRFQNVQMRKQQSNFDTLREFQDKVTELYENAKESVISAYHKYRGYYDRKANASPLSLHSYCLILDPKCITQSDALSKGKLKWLSLYRVEKVLTNSNYIIRKVGTNYTACLHRMRLRPIAPQYPIDDLPDIDEQNFVTDPNINENTSEPQLFDDALVTHIFQKHELPKTLPKRALHFSSETAVATFPRESAANDLLHQASQPTFHDAIDRESFVVEGHMPSHVEESPDVIDVTDFPLDVPQDLPQEEARYGADRRYALRRDDRFALARQYSMYNAIAPSSDKIGSVSSNKWDNIYGVERSISLNSLLSKIMDFQEPILVLQKIRQSEIGGIVPCLQDGILTILIVVRKHELATYSLLAFQNGLNLAQQCLNEMQRKTVSFQLEQFPENIEDDAKKLIIALFSSSFSIQFFRRSSPLIDSNYEDTERTEVTITFPNDETTAHDRAIEPDSDSEISFGPQSENESTDQVSDVSTVPADDISQEEINIELPSLEYTSELESSSHTVVRQNSPPPIQRTSPTPLSGATLKRHYARRIVPLLLNQKIVDGNLHRSFGYEGESD